MARCGFTLEGRGSAAPRPESVEERLWFVEKGNNQHDKSSDRALERSMS
jgi:hypothetical protein